MRPRLKPISLWRIAKSLSNLLAAEQFAILTLKPKTPYKCFKDRLQHEGRFQEYLKKLKEVPPEERCNQWGPVAKEFGFEGYRECFHWLERQLKAIELRGVSEVLQDLAEYRTEYKRMVMETLKEAAASCEFESKPLPEDVAWLFDNWLIAMETNPAEPSQKIANPHHLREAKSRRIYTLADIAERKPEWFLEFAIKHLMAIPNSGGQKPTDSPPQPETPKVDPAVNELNAFLEKCG